MPKQKKQPKTSFKERLEAMKVFFDTEDIEKAAKAVGRRKATVSSWARQDGWRKELEKIHDRVRTNLLDRSADIKAAQQREKLLSLDYAVSMRVNSLFVKAMELFEQKITAPGYDVQIEDLRTLFEIRKESTELSFRGNGTLSELGPVQIQGQGPGNQLTLNLNNITPEDRHAIIVDTIAAAPVSKPQIEDKEPVTAETQ